MLVTHIGLPYSMIFYVTVANSRLLHELVSPVLGIIHPSIRAASSALAAAMPEWSALDLT